MAENNGAVAYENNPNMPKVPQELRGKNGTVTGKKDKSLKSKIVNFLAGDKLDSIGSYLMNYVVKPGLIGIAWQFGTNALSMMLFGGNNAAPPAAGGTYIPGYGYQPVRRDPVPYQNYGYQGNPGGYNYGYAQPNQPNMLPAGGKPLSLTEVSFDTKDDAWLVIDRMGRELGRYGKVKVGDFYRNAGITGQESDWVLQNTGWTSLAGTEPKQRLDGRWIIDFPNTQIV